MTEPGDKLARRYREAAREEPPPAIDAAILAASRRAVGARPGGVRRWAGPVSIAAVLVLGIGVSLRMQMEQPGIETAVPSSPASEYTMPAIADPAPAEASKPPQPVEAAKPPAKPAPKPTPERLDSFALQPTPKARMEAERNVAPAAEANPFADGPVVMQQAPVPAPSAATPQLSLQSAPMRAKREAATSDAAAGARELRKADAPDPDPARELERIARLRESANHAEADRALDEFRRRHPDFRIPEAMWERVKRR